MRLWDVEMIETSSRDFSGSIDRERNTNQSRCSSLVEVVAVETKDNTVLPECEKRVLHRKTGGSEISAAVMERRIEISQTIKSINTSSLRNPILQAFPSDLFPVYHTLVIANYLFCVHQSEIKFNLNFKNSKKYNFLYGELIKNTRSGYLFIST